ncbi:hypothetical protein ATI61_107299 [Archangium gephyra]|uniref:Uncharacterized protein n=1 Tax=Archangium gephyra TaxID=48 RepID=A0AAC8QIA8_9BACT|nr:hypothetical protein [Archangium gephyra]AKJ07854.1 Hypothetical protein AA314_09480 [Archangium gephyra]REG29603.1 hypothetical protein ATI61_107299 [Archangium gephyra]
MRTTTRVPGALRVLALLGLLLLPGAALAQEQKLKVEVEVVLVSRKGTEVDPPQLQKMKETFQRQNFNFTSFKRLSQQSLEVSSKEPTEVKLPNGVNASLKLLRMQGDTATLRVDVPQLSAVDVELGREGAVYQRAGKHVGGELILVLTAPPAK